MKSKLNLKTSPFSIIAPDAHAERIKKLLEELDEVIQKHGFDSYLLSVLDSSKPKGIYTSAYCPNDSSVAAGLLNDASRAYFELSRTQTPNAPGGNA